MEEKEIIRLTQYSRGAGCGCKIAPAVLQEILKGGVAPTNNPKLLVGNASNDDAAVYDLGNGTALISTTDFFMPIVDDAFDFGRIAAANAISDVYAMGGTPLIAVAILGWPVEKLPASLAAKVLEGARAICAEAGIPLAGGHSIDATEPIFGLAVNGLMDINHLKRNNTAKVGDVLLLTKAIGTGILSTAEKRGLLKEEHVAGFISQLITLNKVGALLGNMQGVTAMTDVTGFGLAGHLVEMADGADISAEIYYDEVPVMAGVRDYIRDRIVPDATYRNWNAYAGTIAFGPGVDVMEAFCLLPDPQTNGGLLIAVDPLAIEELLALLDSNGYNHCHAIGHFTERGEKAITVRQSK